jgi:predicted Zn-dependent peptidase
MHLLKLVFLPTLFLILYSCQTDSDVLETQIETDANGYSYEYVSNDPSNTRVYTLDNGLKVYLSVYKEEPRIMTFIPVKAGGKNDPANSTGLAHYLEHMLFKGSADYGTKDWEKEKPLIDEIERLFEEYRTLDDPEERKAHYAKIDKVSKEASEYAVANEYDKMCAYLGYTMTNAYTTEDRTVYMNNIPSNQLENFLDIESNRFQIIVNRLFHTELETVYEEKNRSLDNDYWKAFEAMHKEIFPNHKYGTQTVIGTIEHLKNP